MRLTTIPMWCWLLLAALAAYRTSHMLVHEEGPFSLLQKLRNVLDPDERTWIGRGVNCILCSSFWAALLMLALLAWEWGMLLVAWWAIAGIVLLLHRGRR